MLFQGEEWAASTPWQFFTSHPEPELGEATAKGRIAEFAEMGWDESVVPDPQDPETFTRSKLNWDEVTTGRHVRLLSLYRELARLRREVPELTDPAWPDAGQREVAGGRVYRLDRGAVTVWVNVSEADVTVETDAASEVLLATDPATAAIPAGLRLPAVSATIVRAAGEGAR